MNPGDATPIAQSRPARKGKKQTQTDKQWTSGVGQVKSCAQVGSAEQIPHELQKEMCWVIHLYVRLTRGPVNKATNKYNAGSRLNCCGCASAGIRRAIGGFKNDGNVKIARWMIPSKLSTPTCEMWCWWREQTGEEGKLMHAHSRDVVRNVEVVNQKRVDF